MALKYVQTPTLYLQGSGVIIGAVNIVVTSFTDVFNNQLAMTDFGTKGYGTLEPDTNNEEPFTFTSVTLNANGTTTLGGVSSGLAKSPYTETSGLVRQHSGGTKMVVTDNVEFWNTFGNKNNDETVTGQWTFTNTPITPPAVSNASSTVAGITKLSVNPAVPTNPIAVGVNDTTVFAAVTAGVSTGAIIKNDSRTLPAGYIASDGSAQSRTGATANLFNALFPSKTVTITIATPGVLTATAHGFLAGDRVSFTTTGALPTGLAVATYYYVIATGLTTNAFEVSTTLGGSAVNTTGSQSGTHTVYLSNYGIGDGSTTFNLPTELNQNYPMPLFDAYSSGGAAATSVTGNHTCSGGDRFLIVAVSTVSATPPTVTYNSVALTLNTSQAGAASVSTYLFSLANPTLGTNTLSITGGTSTLDYVATSWNGVSAYDKTDKNSATGASIPSTITPTYNNELVLMIVQPNGTIISTSGYLGVEVYVSVNRSLYMMSYLPNHITNNIQILNPTLSGSVTYHYITAAFVNSSNNNNNYQFKIIKT